MSSFALNFKNKAIERDFIRSQRPLSEWFFFFVIFTLSFIAIVVVISFANYFDCLVATLACAPFIVIIGCLSWFKHFRFMELFVILSCLVICSLSLYFRVQGVVSLEEVAFGYFLGFFERVIIERLPLFRHKAFYGLFAAIIQIIIMRHDTAGDLVFRGSLTLVGFIVDYTKEKKERDFFKSFYDSRQTISKFKGLLDSLSSESVIVVDEMLKQTLFANQMFEQTFGKTPSEVPIQDFLNCFKLKKGIRLKDFPAQQGAETHLDVGDLQERQEPEKKESNGLISPVAEDQAEPNLYTTLLRSKDFLNESKKCLLDQMYTFHVPNSQEERVFRIKVLPFSWNGQVSYALLFNDVTESVTFKDLKTLQENKDQALSMISHELRTPLNSIVGMIQLLEKEIARPHLQRYLKVCNNSAKLLLSLVNSILDMDQIKNSKLRLNLSKCKIEDIIEDVSSMFDFQCQQKNIYLKKNLAEDVPTFVITDRNRLAQILINLVGNALKFTNKGGITISIGRDVGEQDKVLFKVADTGVGIKEQDKEKLFKKYGKLKRTEKINIQGVGLGLSISNMLVKLLNESSEDVGITVESQYGKGSEFSFTIKTRVGDEQENISNIVGGNAETKKGDEKRSSLEEEEEKDSSSDKEDIGFDFDEKTSERKSIKHQIDLSDKLRNYRTMTNTFQINLESQNVLLARREDSIISLNEDQGSVTARRSSLTPVSSRVISIDLASTSRKSKGWVLIVDDSPFSSLATKELIEAQGFSTEVASNGKLAINQALSRKKNGEPFHLIFMDYQMPVMNGLEAARVLINKMKNGEINETPIVALTGDSRESILQECIEIGIVECITKPLFEENLKEVLAKYIG